MSFDFKQINDYEKKVIDATKDAIDRARLLYYSVPTAVTFSPFTWERTKEKPTHLWGIDVVTKMGQDPRIGALHWDHFALIDHPRRFEFEIGLPEPLQLRAPSPPDYSFPRLAHLSEHSKLVDVRKLRSIHDALDYAAREIERLGE